MKSVRRRKFNMIKDTLKLKIYILINVLKNKKTFKDSGKINIKIPLYKLTGFNISNWMIKTVNSILGECDYFFEEDNIDRYRIIAIVKKRQK